MPSKRTRLEQESRLNFQGVLDFGSHVGQDFSDAQRGCEVFVSAYFGEKIGSAPTN